MSSSRTLRFKVQRLVSFWHDHVDLSLEQLMHPARWPQFHGHFSIAHVLDDLIRQQQGAELPKPLPAAEESWIDRGKIDLSSQESFSFSTCVVHFKKIPDECPIAVKFQAGSTLRSLLQAHSKLVGPLVVLQVLGTNGSPMIIALR